jgi:hypothetical protein
MGLLASKKSSFSTSTCSLGYNMWLWKRFKNCSSSPLIAHKLPKVRTFRNGPMYRFLFLFEFFWISEVIFQTCEVLEHDFWNVLFFLYHLMGTYLPKCSDTKYSIISWILMMFLVYIYICCCRNGWTFGWCETRH